MSRIDGSGDLAISGHLSAGSMTIPDNAITSNAQIQVGADITRAKCAQVAFDSFPVPLTSLRRWDAISQVLPATDDGSDDLWLSSGTWGTNARLVKSDDAASTTATQYAYFEIAIPDNYEADESVRIRIRAKMETIADTTCTIDLEVYEPDGDGSIGSDLCATTAQNLTAAWANYDFTITDSGLEPGDTLMCRIKITLEDAATGSGVVADISAIALQCDTRG